MQIPDFQRRLSATSAGGAFKASGKWFIFQRKIISEVYGRFKGRDAFNIYLYLCKHYDLRKKVTNKSVEKINGELQYSTGKTTYSKKVGDSLKWLEAEGFIEVIRTHKQQRFLSRIRVAPDFHFNRQNFVKNDQSNLELGWMKGHKHGYIMLPYDVMAHTMLADTVTAKKEWTIRRLQTLILLYAYCWLEFYGGIDPDCVTIDLQGKLSLGSRFCLALKCSNAEAIKTVISLIKDDHFKPVECWFEKDIFGDDIYMGDVGTYTPAPATNAVRKIVLRPTWLIKPKLESEVIKIKKGGIRL